MIEHIFWWLLGSLADSNLFANLVSSFIGAAAAIGVYYLGVRHDLDKRNQIEKEKNSSLIDYLKLSVKVTLSDLRAYVIELKKYIREIEENPLEITSFDSIHFAYVEKLYHKVDQNEILIAFRSRFAVEEAIRLFTYTFSSIDYLYSTIPMIMKQQEQAIEKDLGRRHQYKKIVESFIEQTALIHTTTGKKYGDAFINEIRKIMIDFYRDLPANNTIKFHQEKIISVLPRYLSEQYSDFSELVSLAMEGSRATIVYADIVSNNKHHANAINRFVDELEKVATRLKEVCLKLDPAFVEKEKNGTPSDTQAVVSAGKNNEIVQS